MSVDALDEVQLRRLLEAGRSLVSQLDPDVLLEELLEIARELTGAQYAAIGVLDEDRRELERFLTVGVDAATHRAIGDLPRGRGILGVLIDDPRPLRLHRVGDDPRSYGFPPRHPPMGSFLGVPVMIRGEAWGNLYLTEKQDGADFTAADEDAIVVLADWAAIAIENARLYQASENRRTALERAVSGLEATTAIARAVGGETDLARVLELIVKRGRALVEARALVIVLREHEQLVVAAGAGDAAGAVTGARLPGGLGPLNDVMRLQRPERFDDVGARLGMPADLLGAADARTALIVPLVFRGGALGVLCAFDRVAAEPGFDAEHERLLLAFAASAATAVATARTVADERMRLTMRAAEAERSRWARELHDDTLQALAALRVVLSGALRRGDPGQLDAAVRDALDQITDGIAGLRALITDLRPAALDELGLAPALEALARRVGETHDLAVQMKLEEIEARLDPDTETAVYRLVQEALTNVVKHSGAKSVGIGLSEVEGELRVQVDDDGRGFDPRAPAGGFGLIGMRERVELLGGRLAVEAREPGTTVTAYVPAKRRDQRAAASAG